MNAVAIVDSTILCELLEVPGKSNASGPTFASLQDKGRHGEGFLLPLAALIETGNHIGQLPEGHVRRDRAQKFVRIIDNALNSSSPFLPLWYWDEDSVRSWLREFPAWTDRRSGLGDLSIKHEWERQCLLNRGRRVYVWSLDKHLAAFDTGPRT